MAPITAPHVFGLVLEKDLSTRPHLRLGEESLRCVKCLLAL